MNNNENIDALKLKLKSATKLKLQRDRELCKIGDKERSMNEELEMFKGHNEFLTGQVEDVKKQMVQARHHLSMIGICAATENVKTAGHIRDLQSHRKGFQDIFDKERNIYELRTKELQEKEAAEEEILRQKEKETAERNESQAAVIDAECEALERECVILKKRNNAIMLKLRRKLVETEKARREVMKRNMASVENDNTE